MSEPPPAEADVLPPLDSTLHQKVVPQAAGSLREATVLPGSEIQNRLELLRLLVWVHERVPLSLPRPEPRGDG